MPQLVIMSIAVSLSPRAAKGLRALVSERLTSGSADDDGSLRNTVTENHGGTVVQARDIHGGIHLG